LAARNSGKSLTICSLANVVAAETRSARQTGAFAARRQIGLVGFLDRSAGALVEAQSGRRRRQAARRARQKPHPQALFELCDRFGDRRLTKIQLPGRG
jgi:hypothetical protein